MSPCMQSKVPRFHGLNRPLKHVTLYAEQGTKVPWPEQAIETCHLVCRARFHGLNRPLKHVTLYAEQGSMV